MLNVCNTTIIQDAWAREQSLSIHGWIYSVNDGVLRDLEVSVHHAKEAKAAYEDAIEKRQ